MSDTVFTFVLSHAPELIQKIYEQLYLAGSAIIIAILISVPLGVWAARSKTLRGPVLGVTNILQTIPSLALLAFLIPFVGIGAKPAIITLSIYALLPIVRNTTTGLLNISPILIEAADSLGLTESQKLWRVELPIALPIMLAGIRTATTLCVGTATLAAFVGGGGLGDFIYQGLSLNNNKLILLGAIPAALLVLVLDFIIAQIENSLNKKKRRQHVQRHHRLKQAVVISMLVLLSIKPLSFLWATCQDNVIRIGSRYDAEQIILGEIIAQTLEKKTNLKVIRKFNLVSPGVANNAIINAHVDIIPEYTGTAFMVELHGKIRHRPKNLYRYVSSQYQKKYHITWLKPFGLNNTNTVVIDRDVAKDHHINKISDLARFSSQWTIAVPGDFMIREDGYKGLYDMYGLHFSHVRLMEMGLLYSAIHNHRVDLAMGSSTDGRIAAYNLTLLKDDKHVFPEYFAAPIIRNDILHRHPEIKTALAAVLGTLTNKKIAQLNYQVDVRKRSVAAVVEEYLRRV